MHATDIKKVGTFFNVSSVKHVRLIHSVRFIFQRRMTTSIRVKLNKSDDHTIEHKQIQSIKMFDNQQ